MKRVPPRRSDRRQDDQPTLIEQFEATPEGKAAMETEPLDEIRAALRGEKVRIEFSPSANLTTGQMVDTVRVYVPARNGRWKQAGPFLVGNDRRQMLEMLGLVAQEALEELKATDEVVA